MLLVLGFALMIAAAGLALARELVIRRITSRSLGSLAPGFAATRAGYAVYVFLVFDLGAFAVALGIGSAPLTVIAVVLFVVASLTVLAGEVRTYRGLKR